MFPKPHPDKRDKQTKTKTKTKKNYRSVSLRNVDVKIQSKLLNKQF